MGYLARDVMNTDVLAVSNSMDLRDLAKMFLERGITGAPVVDGEGNLEGVISQTDLIYYNLTRDDELVMSSDFYQNARVEGRHVPSGFQIEDCNSGCVADVMTPVVHSVTGNATLESVARLMAREHIHRVIVRRGRKVAGVISALDVLEVQNRPQRSAVSPTKSKAAKPRAAKDKAAKPRAAKAKAAKPRTAKPKAAKPKAATSRRASRRR